MRAHLLFFAALIGATLGRELQSSAPRVIAEAYECDDQNQEIQAGEPREIGYEIRVCVTPNTPTRQRDVFVRSIETFTFSQQGGDASQRVIESRVEVDTNTLLLCLPGSLVCSFKTRLSDELFHDNVNGTISGSGEVAMQFGTGLAARMLRAQVVPRTLQLAGVQGGFAGISSVKMELSARNAPARPADESIFVNEDVDKQWEGTPILLKILLIAGGVAFFACCVCACCVCGLLVSQSLDSSKNEDDERRSSERNVYKEEPPQSHWAGSNHSSSGYPIQNDCNVERSADTSSSSTEKDEENQQTPTRRFTEAPQPRQALPPQIEESSGDETELPTEPTDMDVCFDADEHPGTTAFIKALKSSLCKFSDEEYGPPIYRFVKKQLPDRRFFICDDEDAPDVWREVTKKELIELVGTQFDAAKATFKKPTKKKISKEASEEKEVILAEVVAFWKPDSKPKVAATEASKEAVE
jgi:hypothetical protein